MGLYRIKNYNLKIDDISESDRVISGYFSAFNNEDSDGDTIVKGAFKKTISERGPDSDHPRIKHLLDHDTRKSIGKLQELSEDRKGLRYVSKLGRHTAGKDALFMALDGLITEHSIGFETLKEERNNSEQTSVLREIRLWEGSSLQTWGANPDTPLTGVKGLIKTKEDYIERIDTLTKAIRNGKYSDETFDYLEIELKQIQAFIATFDEAPKPEQSTKVVDEDEDMKAVKYLEQILN